MLVEAVLVEFFAHPAGVQRQRGRKSRVMFNSDLHFPSLKALSVHWTIMAYHRLILQSE